MLGWRQYWWTLHTTSNQSCDAIGSLEWRKGAPILLTGWHLVVEARQWEASLASHWGSAQRCGLREKHQGLTGVCMSDPSVFLSFPFLQCRQKVAPGQYQVTFSQKCRWKHASDLIRFTTQMQIIYLLILNCASCDLIQNYWKLCLWLWCNNHHWYLKVLWQDKILV